MRLIYFLVSFFGSSRINGVTCQRVRRINVIDPKTVVQKQDSTTSVDEENWAYPMNNKILKRPINILSLGGAVTWGATLDDRNIAYPWLIGSPNSNNVDNLASPEFEAYYYAMCLESTIPDSSSKNYDVILLDFVLSEFEGFPWLLQRLRERYPDAILIYIHIWPFKALVKDNHGLQPDVVGLDQKTDWHWNHGNFSIHNFNPQIMHGAKQAVAESGGHFIYLPFPKDPKEALEWFSSDWWHLSALGHKMVADKVLKLLSTMKDDLFKEKRLGTFGFGDQCVSWVLSGKLDLPHYFTKMVKVSKDDSKNMFADEWQLQWESDDYPQSYAEIEFTSKLSHSSPVILAYFRESDLEYSRSSVEVTVNDLPSVIINPNHLYAPKFFSNVKYASAGEVHPGKNMIRFKNMDQNASPFGIVGLLTNGDTSRSTNLLKLSENMSTISQHIVYCFMQPDPRKSNFRINLDVVEAVITTTLGRLHPSWEIHVITNSDEAIKRLTSHNKLRVIDYRELPFSHSVTRFANQLYIHQSRNDIEYEKFCMVRWIIIYEYFAYLQRQGLSVKYVLAADSDVIILEDPFIVDKTISWDSVESYKILDGALILWSLQGLKNYADFFLEVYWTRENAIEMVKKHGFIVDACDETKSLLIPCFTEDSKVFMYHVSDMNWYFAFNSLSPESRVNKDVFDCVRVGIWSGPEYHFIRDENKFKYDGELLCVIHFNNRAKPLAVSFHSFVFGQELEYVIGKF
jgi:hypothetical protein